MRQTTAISKCTRAVKILLTALLLVTVSGRISAQTKATDRKLMLIINSYHEDESWANNMLQPIKISLQKYPSIYSEQVYLNNATIRNVETYQNLCDNIFETYENTHPSYVVFMGNFSFTLRDRVKKEWGDIPMLLISRIEDFGPLEEYLSEIEDAESISSKNQTSLVRLRKGYNFTAVIVPDYYRETVDLMMATIPNMEKFVFASDKSYVNKVAAHNIHNYLTEKYPQVEFEWIQASVNTRNHFSDYLTFAAPTTGILLSSWVYEITNTRGFRAMTNKELSYIWGSPNPVFTMRQMYLNLGCIGGVFTDNEKVKKDIEDIIEAMAEGESMHSLPFYIPDDKHPQLNYSLLKKYNLSTKNCPPNTNFTNKPLSFWKKYMIIGIVLLVLSLVAIVISMLYNRKYRSRIRVLQGFRDFLDNMPIPYTKATFWLSPTKNVESISYDLKNAAYDEVIRNNGLPNNALHLFPDEVLTEIMKKVKTTGKPVSFTNHFKQTDTYYHFIFIPVSINRTDHNPLKSFELDIFAIDLTKDHQMEQKLKDQAVTIDMAMEMARMIPWQWDAKGNTISFYPYRRYHKYKGLDDSKKITLSFDSYINQLPDEAKNKVLEVYEKITSGQISRFDIQYPVTNSIDSNDPNKLEWYENHGIVTDTDSDGKPIRITGSLQNITQNKHQERILTEAMHKASESDRLKSAFLANMSHEIRTPLNAIVGFSNLLCETDDLAERKEYADIINRNNDFLLILINDILDLAKIESNTIVLNYDLCDIKDVIDSIGKTMSLRIPEGVRFNIVHWADSLIAKADSAHISQILINFLTNATKFTKKGSITVGYEAREEDGEIYFYVKDTGIGIKKENLDKVFTRFVKLNEFAQGTGLGLAICSTLVDKMGGKIGVESAGEGRGSLFWFTIPYIPGRLEDVKNVTNKVESVAALGSDIKIAEQAAPYAQAMAKIPEGLNLLVVEDNPSNFWLMNRLMHDKFTIYHAENGKIGVEMYKEIKPDLIVMDINMPVMNGYEAIAEIRKLSKDVPVIAVTAYAFPSDRVKILNSGFSAYVSKPISAGEMYETIVNVLGMGGAENQN